MIEFLQWEREGGIRLLFLFLRNFGRAADLLSILFGRWRRFLFLVHVAKGRLARRLLIGGRFVLLRGIVLLLLILLLLILRIAGRVLLLLGVGLFLVLLLLILILLLLFVVLLLLLLLFFLFVRFLQERLQLFP